MSWYPIVNGFLIGVVIANFIVGRWVLMHWRSSLRREHVLLNGMSQLSEALMKGDPQEVYEAHAATGVRFVDELHNQGRHAGAFWPRVPQVGESWPDFEPALLSFVDAEGDDGLAIREVEQDDH